jgi:hypothetical protein
MRELDAAVHQLRERGGRVVADVPVQIGLVEAVDRDQQDVLRGGRASGRRRRDPRREHDAGHSEQEHDKKETSHLNPLRFGLDDEDGSSEPGAAAGVAGW